MSAHSTSSSDAAEGPRSTPINGDLMVQELTRDLRSALEGVPIERRIATSAPERLQALDLIVCLVNVTYRGDNTKAAQLLAQIDALISSCGLAIPAIFESATRLCEGAFHAAALNYKVSTELQTEALRLARLSGDDDLAVICQLQLARNDYQSGSLTTSIEILASIATRSDVSSFNTATVHGYLAELCAHHQLWPSVEQHLLLALDLDPGFGEISRVRHQVAYVIALSGSGRVTDSAAMLNELGASAEARSNPMTAALVDIAAAGVSQFKRDYAQAASLAAQAIAVIEAHGNTYHLVRARRIRAAALSRLGRADEALELLDQAEFAAMGGWSRRPTLNLRLFIARSQKRWSDVVALQLEIRDHDQALRRDLARLYSLLSKYRSDPDLRRTRVKLEIINDRLRLARTERDRLLHIVAHDLKSPLSALDLTLDLIDSDTSKGVAVGDRVESASKIASRVQKIASQLSALHDLEGQAFYVSQEELDVEELLLQILREYEPSADAKQISVELVLNPSQSRPVIVKADKAKLLQVFDNLVSNALKYSYPSGHVAIVVRSCDTEADGRESGAVQIQFIDEGQGLSESDLQMIFGKYSRLSAKPTAGETSSGIGLYIASSFANAMAGSLSASSKGKGCGSTFSLTVPAGHNTIKAGDDVTVP